MGVLLKLAEFNICSSKVHVFGHFLSHSHNKGHHNSFILDLLCREVIKCHSISFTRERLNFDIFEGHTPVCLCCGPCASSDLV